MTSTEPKTSLKKGSEIVTEIEALAFGGHGISHVNDMVVFIPGAIPGQKVRAIIVKKKKNYREARINEILQQSPLFVEPRCSHFGACGGCALQHLDYQEQLKAKQSQVVETLEHIGSLSGFLVESILPSPDVFFYRNKMEFSFSRYRWLTKEEIESGADLNRQGLFIGLHAKGFFDKIVDIHDCQLLHPVANEILDTVREFATRSQLPVYSTRDHTGFWRFLVIRKSKHTEDLMVNLVLSRYDEEIADHYKALMMERFPQITSLLYSVTASKASVAYSEKEYVLAGHKTILEKLGDYTFEISGNSFFQTNTRGAERLYDAVVEYADFHGDETVYDLYSGAGTISIYISKLVNKVIGFEAVTSAVQDAHRNAQRNDISNCEFVAGDLRDVLSDTTRITSQYGKPDVMIIDPPRGGMHPKTVQAILKLKPERIVHVSCNPATLARDLNVLCEQDYRLIKVRPVDMFPHTAHIEVVAQLVRR